MMSSLANMDLKHTKIKSLAKASIVFEFKDPPAKAGSNSGDNSGGNSNGGGNSSIAPIFKWENKKNFHFIGFRQSNSLLNKLKEAVQ